MIENTTLTETQKQGFFLAPPLKPRKRKLQENCFRSYIDQLPDGYSGSILVRNEPRKTSDTYFIIKTRATSIRSYRRNYSHKSVALYRTKKDGATRGNIAYMTCSFLELDGSNDNTLKTQRDIYTLINKNNLPEASYIIQTSPGHFHLLWTYDNPLPWTTKGESYWLSVQKRYIELFKQGGFLVDKMASLNPTQNLRNPSQLNAYNYKRHCKVEIHKSYSKTSLRAIYKALNGTNIANPKRVRASVKLRRFLRQNETFTGTLAELAETLGIALSTAERIVKRARANGDMFAVGKVGNNKRITRATRYRSGLYLEPQFSEPSLSIFKNNALKKTKLLTDFQANGAEKGKRNKTIFMLGLGLKAQLGKRASVESIRDALEGGARRCHFPEREFERTLQNIMKPEYDTRFSLAKLREWDLLEGAREEEIPCIEDKKNMNESKENRVFKLEQHRTIAQTEEYCPCTCHEKTLGDYMEITDKFAERIWKLASLHAKR